MRRATRPSVGRRGLSFRLGTVAAAVAAATGLAAAGLAGARASTAPSPARYPVPYTFAAGITAGATENGAPPPGANNWKCTPSAAHPRPVILVHGLAATMTDNWQTMSPLLADNGYCVFALTYGTEPGESSFGGLEPMESSAKVLGAFVDKVLAATHAPKVDIVGHSEGATMPDYYLKFLGGAAKVAHFVGLSPVLRGTTFWGLSALYDTDPSAADSMTSGYCQSCDEFLVGSPFITKLDAGGAAVRGVKYTLIVTEYDELVVPYSNGELTAPNVTDIVLQHQCPLDLSDHLAIAGDPVAGRDILNALDPAHAKAPPCTLVAPVVG
jgi:triacylglycerol lipase